MGHKFKASPQMKHLTALTLLVFAASFGWGEEVDWPLELTCVTPSEIFHLHLTGKPKTSWVRALSAYDGRNQTFKKKHVAKKAFNIKEIKIEPSHIRIRTSGGPAVARGSNLWIISRYTLQMHNAHTHPDRAPHGTCELGFRELESFKRLF